MKNKAMSNLKKAFGAYKKSVKQPITVEFQEEHLNTICRALEVYQRLRMGQIDNALTEAFGWPQNRDAIDKVHKIARENLEQFKDLGSVNASWGIFNQEKVGDATLAYEVYKTIKRYQIFERNDGWVEGWNVDYNVPSNHTGIPFPEIKGFKDYKMFKVPKRLASKIEKFFNLETRDTVNWSTIWNDVDKAMPDLPKGTKAEIVEDLGDIYIKVTEPRREEKKLDDIQDVVLKR